MRGGLLPGIAMANVAHRPDVTYGSLIDRLPGRGPVLGAWLAACALLSACRFVGVSPNADLDDLLKLQKLRAFLESGIWFDQIIPGVLQPEPFSSHWPRVLDLPYAAVAWVAMPFIGGDPALDLAVFAVPLLLLLPALFFYRQLIGRLGFARPDAAFVLALAPAMRSFFEFEPGRIDYHNVQMTLLLAALWLLTARSRGAPFANGAIAAFAMAISIEFAPFYALVAAIYSFDFIRNDDADASRRLQLFAAGLLLSSLASYPLMVAPDAYGTVRCDMYSPPQLLTMAIGAGALGGPAMLCAAARPSMRALSIAVLGGAGLVLVVRLYPQCLGGPYAATDAYLRENWLVHILQERSLFERPDLVLSASMLGAALLFVGAAALPAAAWRDRLRNRDLATFAAFALLALVLAILHSRTGRYLPMFAAPGLLLVLAAAWPAFAATGSALSFNRDSALPSRPAAIAPGLAVAGLVIALTAALPRPEETPAPAQFAGSCDIDGYSAVWPGSARIMAPPDLAIRLLPDLGSAAVIAVPYHTGLAGLERAYRFLDPATPDPRALLEESKASHVAICAWPGEPPPGLRARFPLAAGLMEGRAPSWLTPCPTAPASPVRVYRYIAAGPPGAACPTTP